jgi:predicted NUDIX family NTP pyrophosphohydrolase
MPLQSTGTFKLESKSKSGRIHVPAELVRDSQFPLREGEVFIEIKDNKLLISMVGS